MNYHDDEEFETLCVELNQQLQRPPMSHRPRTAESALIAKQTKDFLASGRQVHVIQQGETSGFLDTLMNQAPVNRERSMAKLAASVGLVGLDDLLAEPARGH